MRISWFNYEGYRINTTTKNNAMSPVSSIIILFFLLIFCSSSLPLLENIWAALRMLLLTDSISPSLFWFCSIDPILLRITFAVLSIVFFAWYILFSGVPYFSQSDLTIRSMSALFTVEDGLFSSSGTLFDRSECRLLNMCDAEPSLSSVSASITVDCIFTILLIIKQQAVCMWVCQKAAWTSFRTSLTVSSSSHPWSNYEMIISLPWVCLMMLIAWLTYYSIMNRTYSRVVFLALCRWQVVIDDVAGSDSPITA